MPETSGPNRLRGQSYNPASSSISERRLGRHHYESRPYRGKHLEDTLAQALALCYLHMKSTLCEITSMALNITELRPKKAEPLGEDENLQKAGILNVAFCGLL